MKHRVLFLLGILLLTVTAAFHTTALQSSGSPGVWLQTDRANSNQNACSTNATCVEWCYVILGLGAVPSGNTCCVPNNELPSDDYSACLQPIPR